MKVLLIGDSPLAKTGFGRVNRIAAEAFLREGWEVAAVANLQKDSADNDLGITLYVPDHAKDAMGLAKSAEAIAEFQPDVVYATGDPGSIVSFTTAIPASMPVFFYCPIEGEPIALPAWKHVLREVPFMTCSNYGAEIVRRDLNREVEMAYHGVNREVFKPLTPERRAEIRELLNWTDKFVVMTVATNVRRKQHPRLFEAMRILRDDYKQRDIVLYDHTVPFQRFYLEGWDLPSLADTMGVYDEVYFNPMMVKGFGSAVPEAAEGAVPGLAELYGAADMFVLPSQVEGFGLPIVEAMACGLPVAVTKYAAGWEVAQTGQGIGLPIIDWEIHKSGTRYANVDPRGIAKAILSLKRDPKRRQRMSDAGIAAAEQFNWSDFERAVVRGIKEVAAEGPQAEVSGTAEAAGQGREEEGSGL